MKTIEIESEYQDRWDKEPWCAVITVGRSAKENDTLFHKSSQNDIWFHAKDVPSAHVYLHWKMEDGYSQPSDDDSSTRKLVYNQCANLVKEHSKKCPDSARINYIERRHIAKDKYCKPGEIILKKSPSLM